MLSKDFAELDKKANSAKFVATCVAKLFIMRHLWLAFGELPMVFALYATAVFTGLRAGELAACAGMT